MAERQIGRDFGPGAPPGGEAGDPATELLVIRITDGQFDGAWYGQSTVRLLVKAVGGPYLFSIDRLLEPRELPTTGSTESPLRLSEPGQYTMRVRSPAGPTPTAVLDVQH